MKLILEFGCNHNGDFNIAKKMIDEASKLGVWGIKLQKRDLGSIPLEVRNRKRSLDNSFGGTYGEHREALEFYIQQIRELKKYSERKGLKFICSAFDLISAKQLIDIDCEFIKLPSQLYLNHEMFRLLSNHKRKVFVSIGMHEIKEVLNSKWLDEAFCVMHCISEYPFNYKDSQLGTISLLYKCVKNFIGYSSHDKEGLAIPYAVVAGALYIERHFTLDKTMKGTDHGTVSSDPQDIKKIIKEVNKIEKMAEYKKLSEEEKKIRKIYRGF